MAERQGPGSVFEVESTGMPVVFYVFDPITNFIAVPGSLASSIDLSWTNPTNPEFEKVIIRRQVGGYPTGPTDGSLVYDGILEVLTDTGLPAGVIYYYAAWAYDFWGVPSSVALTASEPSTPGVTAMTIGLLEAIIDAIGEQDAEIGGIRITRLTSIAGQGDCSIGVETTEDWEDSGKIGIDGIKYSYSGKTPISFTGITHVAASVITAGCAIAHRIESQVVDVSRTWTEMEQLRRSLFVDYAVSDELNVIGRNLGVDRLPLFRDDDQFREVVKVLAYNPKATILGIDLVLTGIVGAGNYVIYEDLLQHNNTIFIRILSAAVEELISAGKSFLQSSVYDTLGGTQDELDLPVGSVPIAIEGVSLPDLDELFDVRAQLPSAITYDYYPGALAPGSAFVYAGSETEGAVMSNPSNAHLNFLTVTTGGSALYEMDGPSGARIVPESNVAVSMLVRFPTGHGLVLTDLEQWYMHIHDGQKVIGLGTGATGGGAPIVGLYKPGGVVFQGDTVTLVDDVFYEVTVWKKGEDVIELFVNGQFITRVDYSVFAADVNHQIIFGIDPITATREVDLKQIGIYIHTATDYWSDEYAAGETFVGPNETKFDSNIVGYFLAGDVGNRIDIWGSLLTNPSGGNNNGSWLIASLPVTPGPEIILVGPEHTGAIVETTYPTRITVGAEDAFTFPDDLGKKIVISGSVTTNDGTYTITKLLKEVTFDDLVADFDTEISQTTTICECAGATFVSEVELDWQLAPNNIVETGLNWRLSDAGSLSGLTLTLRNALWVNDLIMGIRFTDVLSAQILENSSDSNTVIQTTPTVLFEYYPFYVSDPMGIIQAYIATITAAGVIPEFEII